MLRAIPRQPPSAQRMYSRLRSTNQSGGGLNIIARKLLVLSASLICLASSLSCAQFAPENAPLIAASNKHSNS